MTNQPTQQYAPPPPQTAAPTPKGLAITALVVGIVAFLTGLVPVLGFLVGAVAVVFGIIALVKKQSKGLAITGLVLGAVGLITSIAMTAGLASIGNEVAKSVEEAEVAIEEAAPEVEEEPAEPEPEPVPEPEAPERLTLDEGWEVGTDEFGVYTVVNGYVSNNSDDAITNYVQITFDTYDSEGSNLGTCLANTNSIDANGKWKFEAHCFEESDGVADVKFKEITGF